jgi:hypothetical protein
MPARRKLMLPFTHWPSKDRHRWEAAFDLVTCLMKMAPAPALPQLHVACGCGAMGGFWDFCRPNIRNS